MSVARRSRNSIQAYCPRCRHKQRFVPAKINHLLHLALSILPCGLWLVSWAAIIVSTLTHRWRCKHCGYHKPDFRDRASPGPALAGARSTADRRR